MYYGKIALESPLSPNEITDVISSALPKRWVRDYSEMFYGKVKGNYFRLYHPQYDKMGVKPIFFPCHDWQSITKSSRCYHYDIYESTASRIFIVINDVNFFRW